MWHESALRSSDKSHHHPPPARPEIALDENNLLPRAENVKPASRVPRLVALETAVAQPKNRVGHMNATPSGGRPVEGKIGSVVDEPAPVDVCRGALTDPEARALTVLGGDVPSPINPPSGCRFHTRCSQRMKRCDRETVPLYVADKGSCRCFLYGSSEESVGET